MGNELLAVLCLFPVVFRAVHKHLMIETRDCELDRDAVGPADRDFIAVLIKEVPKVS